MLTVAGAHQGSTAQLSAKSMKKVVVILSLFTEGMYARGCTSKGWFISASPVTSLASVHTPNLKHTSDLSTDPNSVEIKFKSLLLIRELDGFLHLVLNFSQSQVTTGVLPIALYLFRGLVTHSRFCAMNDEAAAVFQGSGR